MSKVEELYADKDYMDKVNKFNLILNQEPPKEWVKELRPGIKYIPIERLEWQMRSIFGEFWYRVTDLREIAGSIVATVNVRFYNPVTGSWDETEGVGAAPIVASEGDMGVALAVPAAKTFAVKDAVEPLGKIFGKDLNRADQILYDNLDKTKKAEKDMSGALILAFKSYKGADKAKVKELMMEANKKGWPQDMVDELRKKLKVA
jgi:hypothetical protein